MAVDERYRRNMSSLSEEECALLGSRHVTVVGCGGLGGHVIETLARIGVGTIAVVDGDAFEPSNLNRQLLSCEANMGTPKVQSACERVAAINSSVTTVAHHVMLTEENACELVRGSDCVVDALDNVESRFWLGHACQKEGVPVAYGAIAGWFGQVSTVFPGDASFVGIYGREGGEGVQKREGVLPFTAACTAAWQSAEVVKVLLGKEDVLRNRLMMIDMLYGSCECIELG